MASFDGAFSTRPTFTLRLNVDEVSVNRATNQSSVSWSVQIIPPGNFTSYNLNNSTLSVNIGGQASSHLYKYDFRTNPSTARTIASGTAGPFTHGTTGALSVAVSSSTNSGTLGSASNSGTLGLTNFSYQPPSFSDSTINTSTTVGLSYSDSVTAVADGPTGTVTYSTFSGTRPPNINLTSVNGVGVLSGTPTTAGTYQFVIRASNNAGNRDTGTLTITVASNVPSPVFTDSSVASPATVGQAYSDSVQASDITGANYSIDSGAIPTGLTFDTTTALITGTPTVPGVFKFVVRATNVTGTVVTPELTIVVNSPAPVVTSNFSETGSDLGTVTSPYLGYNGSFILQENSDGTTVRVFNANGGVTNNTVNTSGSLAVSSLLNKTYTATEIISKTANSITVQAPPIGVNVSSDTIITTDDQKIVEDSMFNTSVAISATAINDTQFRYTKTGTYNINVSSETVATGARANVLDPVLNVQNTPIIENVVLEDGLYRIRVTNPASGVSPITTITKTVVAEATSFLNGVYQISSKLDENSFRFNISSNYEEHGSLPTYGYSTADNRATITYGSYGSFRSSADLGFDFSTTGSSEENVLPESFRGFELANIGEELEKYTDRIEGFDYRVDCYISPSDNSFRRDFVMVPIYPTAVRQYIESQEGGVLATGESVPIEYFGADSLVFEFPGNISDLQLEESAENAVTRFFMVGNIGDLGDDISQPYAAVADTELLSPSTDSYPWPLLDDDESSNSISDEDELYSYAERYMEENRPPAGNFSVTVNGSVEPLVGSYYPGDWCSLVINDEFIQQRLSSDLEPRSTAADPNDRVLLRRINSYSVDVPDSVTFPEKITLQLIPEWQVDKRGK
jgi:hypothetical protein